MSKLISEICNKKFMVVDDYESMRVMMADHLKQIGVESLKFAKSGNEAFQQMLSFKGTPDSIDFVITDLVMEDGNGIELVKKLRSQEDFKKLPILMVTSKAEVNLVLEAVKAGVNSYIVKPWQLDDLAKKITEVYQKNK
jgi:two-component system chemotaxis response regulator CheY